MKRFFVVLMIPILFLTSCSIEPTIPENARTFSQYMEQKSLYLECVSYFESIEYDAMVSRNDYYSIQGTENITGIYLQNMKDKSISVCDSQPLNALFDQSSVKLVDWIRRGDLSICAFDMCIPGKNFDYGIYYTSGDSPIYFGDPSIELSESGNGYVYEKKASYGAKFTYYTEQIEDHFYYYEIA